MKLVNHDMLKLYANVGKYEIKKAFVKLLKA